LLLSWENSVEVEALTGLREMEVVFTLVSPFTLGAVYRFEGIALMLFYY
jgi:hypothetical protein